MEDFDRLEKEQKCAKLPGFYYFSPKLLKLISVDFECKQLDDVELKQKISKSVSKKLSMLVK